MPSIACFFQAATWFECTSNRLANSASVPSPRIAAKATFALNDAANFLLIFIVSAVRESCGSGKDVNGIYPIERVPLGQLGKISVASTSNLPTITSLPPMKFVEGGTYRNTAQTVAMKTTDRRFDLAICSATAADGKDVLEQILVGENATK